MNRNLNVERLFPLGDFKNIKFVSELKNIPDELAEDEDVAVLLWLKMAFSCDIAYRRYFDTIDRITKEKIKDARSFLEEERSKILEELNVKLQSHEKSPETLVGYAGEQED